MSTAEKNTVAAAIAVEDIARNNLLPPNPKLDNAVANSQKNNLREIAVSPLQGQFLAIQCQLIGAKTVLEIGTLGGYSTIWLAQTGAKVTSIEINPKHRDVALENVSGLDTEIILGAALDVLPKLAAEGRKFDMVFCDASWGEQEKYFDWAVALTRPKGCIYIDNVVWNMLESGAAETGYADSYDINGAHGI
ncbi:O-methyltransferase imqG [Colletotrichum spaethianum]|uniref:O-methyltransferase imqG n=1 Tax=Colletotrichum spaethianum TaxID=700344 RepID=A0AA37PAP4_9PEZI|nr:O-methyltransferase imqG [Colletotrichum spaethianum]GKT48709.1 O-methyltransferase imqG [Colletotrichum spaethianum]